MDQKPCLSAPSTVCNALPISKPDTKISIDNSWLNMLLEITIQLVLVLFNLFPFACSIPHKIIRFLKINGAVFELKTITISWWWKQLKPQVLYLKSTLSQHKTSTEKAHEEICKCHLFKTDFQVICYVHRGAMRQSIQETSRVCSSSICLIWENCYKDTVDEICEAVLKKAKLL